MSANEEYLDQLLRSVQESQNKEPNDAESELIEQQLDEFMNEEEQKTVDELAEQAVEEEIDAFFDEVAKEAVVDESRQTDSEDSLGVDFDALLEEALEENSDDIATQPEMSEESMIQSLLNSMADENFGMEEFEDRQKPEEVDDESAIGDDEEQNGDVSLTDIFNMDVPEPGEKAITEYAESPEKPEYAEDRPIEELAEMAKTDKKRKPGFWKKLAVFCFGEDEDEDEPEEVKELSSVTEENATIMKELDAEDNKKKKGKKGNKKAAKSEEGEAGEEIKVKKEKKQKKKQKKETPKEQPEPEETKEPEKQLSKQKIIMVSVLSFSIMIAILLCVRYMSDSMELKAGRNAYYTGDYQTCYESLYGRKLNDSDDIMFRTSEMALKIERKTEAYEHYLSMDKKAEALNALLQWVSRYEQLLADAQKVGLEDRVKEKQAQVLKILSDTYGLTESKAAKIIASEDDRTYSLCIQAVINGTSLPGEEKKNNKSQKDAVLEQELPAEKELTDNEFINQTVE